MKGESLKEVKAAFEEWRSRKRHLREAVPVALLERARQAARCHGPAAVARATRVGRGRLATRQRMARSGSRSPVALARVPVFSRVELAAPTSAPFAEIEIPTGLRLRLFAQTEATLALLTSLCGPGVGR